MNVLWNEVISRAESEDRTYLMEHECKELLLRSRDTDQQHFSCPKRR